MSSEREWHYSSFARIAVVVGDSAAVAAVVAAAADFADSAVVAAGTVGIALAGFVMD